MSTNLLRPALAKELLELEYAITSQVNRIDQIKEILRSSCTANNNTGFKEILPGLGTVEVKAGASKVCTGFVRELDMTIYLSLSEPTRKSLEEKGVVVEVPTYSREAKPSVSVKLNPNTAAEAA